MRRRLLTILGDSIQGDANRLGKLILRQTVFGKKFLFQHLPGRDRSEFVFLPTSLMTVDYPDIVGVTILPSKDRAPLIVHAYRVETFQISSKLLEPV
jgi:hypothetical protein